MSLRGGKSQVPHPPYEALTCIVSHCRYQPSLQGGHHREAHAMQRGLPSVSDHRQSHAGEKRKHRPPSLSHDNDDDDVQIIDHHHPSTMGGASVPRPRPKATSHERREFGDRQLRTDDKEPSLGFDQGRQRRRVENYQASGHHASTSQATVGHGELHQQPYNPETYYYPSGGHSRQHVSREQRHRERRNDVLDDRGHGTSIHGRDERSNKRQKQRSKVTFE